VSESLNVETTFGVGDKFSTRANRTAAMNAAAMNNASPAFVGFSPFLFGLDSTA
jgi:hypothetical protein